MDTKTVTEKRNNAFIENTIKTSTEKVFKKTKINNKVL